MTSQAALSYEEPDIRTALILSGFLLALNFVNKILDKLVYCGLIGQIFIGVAWGMPGAQWLTHEAQEVMQQLGYLGLLLLVYEGGLSTSFKQLRANLCLSAVAACTGVASPMALSFVLMRLVDATPLQAFGAGAALCSTSIGTTFTVLSTTGLDTSRLGTVLSGAAMMDDVAGLVMVQIISNLGSTGAESFDPVIVVRPICVAIGFAIGTVLVCCMIVKPGMQKMQAANLAIFREGKESQIAFVLHMTTLIGFVTGASYAGTSGLFAAYLAGACISWFDDLVISFDKTLHHTANTSVTAVEDTSTCFEMNNSNGDEQAQLNGKETASVRSAPPANPVNEAATQICSAQKVSSGQQTFDLYCKQPLHLILCPFFFASIGFAIPITQMFEGKVVWRGIVYTLLMALGKVVVGAWLLPITISPVSYLRKVKRAIAVPLTRCTNRHKTIQKQEHGQRAKDRKRTRRASISTNTSPTSQSPRLESRSSRPAERSAPAEQTRSLYPASILGLAMIARGEIGYLIASMAVTGGLFAQPGKGNSNGSSEIYLVVVWAITLCTIIGPICVGTLVKRVKQLQAQRCPSGTPDPLGVWGVS